MQLIKVIPWAFIQLILKYGLHCWVNFLVFDVAPGSNVLTDSLFTHPRGCVCVVYIEEKAQRSQKTSPQPPGARNSMTQRFKVCPLPQAAYCVHTPFCLFLNYFFIFCHAACGILLPQPGIKPTPMHLKCTVLTTGLPGKFPRTHFKAVW